MKLYKENGVWMLPGKQGRHAIRVDVPGTPADLVKWLNDRDVPINPVQRDVLHEAELAALREMPDDQIDTSDIPEQTDWSGAERGKFTRQVTLTDVEEFIQNAPAAPDLASVTSNVCWRLKELLKEAS